MENRNLAAIVLAAGLGTRMHSKHAKVLHPLGGEPMITRSLRAVSALDARPIVVVVGHQAAEVEAAAHADSDAPLRFALQPRLQGTGDSARRGLAAMPEHFTGDVLIGYGDVPMVTVATLAAFCSAHRQSGAALSLVSVRLADPSAYGRVVRDPAGKVQAVVEARDASEAERAINEINTGFYCADVKFLRVALAELKTNNAQGEYYLTDIVSIARARGLEVNA